MTDGEPPHVPTPSDRLAGAIVDRAQREVIARRLGTSQGALVLVASDPADARPSADAVARAFGLTLLRVDLAQVVSKFIGETEKNLSRVFADASRSGAGLLFDEADALFGSRAGVRDSHDRYANLDAAYLLQRIEAFGGLVVLTSNRPQDIDAAVLKRCVAVITVPPPRPRRD